jgi:Zn-dependent protease with chaperone function
MDFFQHQRLARKNTLRLVVLFLIAVALITVAVTLVLVGFFQSGFVEQRIVKPPDGPLWKQPATFYVALGTVAFILLGSLYKILMLASGGAVVAGMLGGLPISPNTSDPDQKKILNVVEEMSIASGIPVPPVFLLSEERGINAFAAGFKPTDAVIGVTSGCIQKLSRDQLQGVIAHEYSHILNGDMRTNIRLIGILHGILMIGLVGEGILRMSFQSSAHRTHRRSSRDNGAGGALAAMVIGALLMIIGYIGVFFGKLIKSAISRQREFLADASAVQFTRNPDGIAGALKVIGGFERGSKLKTVRAEEASHMFFGNALSASYLSLLSTHPPLEERIRRIDPTFDLERREKEGVAKMAPSTFEETGGAMGFAGTTQTAEPTWEEAVARVGRPDPVTLGYAAKLIETLPGAVYEATRDAYGARALVYALLLDAEPEIYEKQVGRLKKFTDPIVFRDTLKYLKAVRSLPAQTRMPLIDLCLPALCQQSGQQYGEFKNNVEFLMGADARIDLFEFALRHVLFRHLRPHFEGAERDRLRPVRLSQCVREAGLLLSFLAHAGGGGPQEAHRSLSQGARRLSQRWEPQLVAKAECHLEGLGAALKKLRGVSPEEKKHLIEACAVTVLEDRKVTAREIEILRAASAALDCPMPPLRVV